ncbi:hypothetical protein [Streptomyces platensis]|uniref:hypothetical protein n=1 Tax=Streptomyces platensis TaxID=58346 RepID=UPI0033237D85
MTVWTFDTDKNWHSRNPTRHGRIRPPQSQINRIGEPSSAKARYEQRISDRALLDSVVQLEPGVLVIYDRAPYRIVEASERPIELWGEQYEKAFAEDLARWERGPRYREKPDKGTWVHRPVVVVLVPDGDPNAKSLHLCGPASKDWPVLDEHYAVCRKCGELPPCREEIADKAVKRQMHRTEARMSIPAGHCLGCGEAITSRMKAVRFPGPNLWRPDLGHDSAVFHARAECRGDVAVYRKQWQVKGIEGAQMTLPGPGEA